MAGNHTVGAIVLQGPSEAEHRQSGFLKPQQDYLREASKEGGISRTSFLARKGGRAALCSRVKP